MFSWLSLLDNGGCLAVSQLCFDGFGGLLRGQLLLLAAGHVLDSDHALVDLVFTDEQRPESWGADARDLCEIIHIKDGGTTELALPFFALEELLYSFIYDKFVGLYLKYRYIRADNTLPMYVFKKLMQFIMIKTLEEIGLWD